MRAYRAQCICGAWPPPNRIQPSSGSPTADRGWVVVEHICVCGRTPLFAHDTEGRMQRTQSAGSDA